MNNNERLQKMNELKHALAIFKESYYDLVVAWENFNEFNDYDAIKKYPFEKSFEDIEIIEWVNLSIKELEQNIANES
ncbi:hypothetical protein [Viridibacillus arvi]|uniref:hypothetical protein n=1 Tax=Viridibacillus arvi TaxID=263475 RepID=UPI003D26DA0F